MNRMLLAFQSSPILPVQNMKFVFSSLILLFLNCFQFGNGQEPFTPEEISALAEFRPLVKDVLYADYMDSNDFLIKWLRDQKLDLDRANQKLRKSIAWRLENKIDNLLYDGSYSKIRNDLSLPYTLEGYDIYRNPVFAIRIAKWNIRRVALAGKRATMRKFWLGLLERATRVARASNGTHWVVVGDMSGYNLRQHGCLACISLYTDFLTEYEANYPETLINVVVINAPRAYVALLELLRPLMSPSLRNVFQTFGYNKIEYSEHLFKTIPPNQLGPEFGGIKNFDLKS